MKPNSSHPTDRGTLPGKPAAEGSRVQGAVKTGFSRGEKASHLARVGLFSLLGLLGYPAIVLRVLLHAGLPRRGPRPLPGRRASWPGGGRASVLPTILAFLPDLAVYVAELSARRPLVRYRYPRSFTDRVVPASGGAEIACTVGAHPAPEVRPTLILLPGMFNTRSQRVLVSLAVRAHSEWGFHVVVADLRGFGDTARLGSSSTGVSLLESDDVAALARWARAHLPTDSVSALGFSYGGAVALGAASRATRGELTACVSCCPYADLREMVEWLSEPLHLDRSLPFNVFYRHLFRQMCRLRGTDDVQTFRDYLQRVVSPQLGISEDELYDRGSPLRYVRELAVPTLLVHAEDDPVIPVEDSARLARAAADSPESASRLQVVTIPRGGHFANWLAAGTETEALVLRFLRARSAAAPDGPARSTSA